MRCSTKRCRGIGVCINDRILKAEREEMVFIEHTGLVSSCCSPFAQKQLRAFFFTQRKHTAQQVCVQDGEFYSL